MPKNTSKNATENISFLAIAMLSIIIGTYFLFAAVVSRISADSQSASSGVVKKVEEKKLDASILDNQKVKQLEVHPREKYDPAKIKAGGKKCPFGGLE